MQGFCFHEWPGFERKRLKGGVIDLNEDKLVLIIEDDQEINKLLQVILRKNSITSAAAFSGTEGLMHLEQGTFDLVLLDLMLPGLSGEELIEKVREKSQVPIIVISAKKDMEDKVHVLKMGADDYITKPFDQEEVVARVEVQLRRPRQSAEESRTRSWRGLALDLDKLEATIDGASLHLTNAEFDILALFLQHPEHAFSKKEIYEKIWQGTYVGDDNTISVHVSNLRKKIAEKTSEEYIKTIWGIGFMLV